MDIFLKRRKTIAGEHAHKLHEEHKNFYVLNSVLRTATISAVKEKLKDKFIVSESENVIVTEIGFVTMAILPEYAIVERNLTLIPGIDEKKQSGYLVLHDNFMPYHSLATNIDQAILETEIAHQRAANLIHYFGDRKSLKRAAKKVPWYQISTLEDARSAGLCRWGTHNFLARTKLTHIGTRFGLPRCLIQFAGSYGNRVTAATIMRQESKENAVSGRSPA